MILLSAAHVTKAFGVDEILKDVNFTLQDQQKLGLVGVNGSGKTTLMRMIAGLDHPDGGQLFIKSELRIGYHAQLGDLLSEKTVYEELLSVFDGLFEIEARLRDMEAQMGTLHDTDPDGYEKLLRDYTRMTDVFEREGGYSYKSAIYGVLNGLSIDKALHDRPVKLLSGGERTRVKLAKLLLQKPELLLLDEPTNHLDLEAIAWLEDYLSACRASVIVISHDRYFLDAVCNTIVELSSGVAEQYEGDYSRFLDLRAQAYERKLKMYTQQQKEIARQKEIIARFRRYNQEWSIKRAKTRENVLAKMDLVDKPQTQQSIEFTFQAHRRTGNDVLIAENLSKAFDGRTLFAGVDLHVRAGDRVAIIGPNGIGKTTLLRMLLGLEPCDSGEILYGTNLDIGYYDQQQSSLDDKKQIIDEIWDEFPRMNMTQVRNALATFLLTEDDVFRPIGTLSGGERGRVMFTKLMLRGDNVLVLDEPTNHLDMDSREVLESALCDFTGTILLVSHDRFFINRIANRVIELSACGIKSYLGNYDDYLAAKNKENEPQIEEPQKTKTALRDEKRRQRLEKEARQQQRALLAQLEREIESKEAEIARLETVLAAPETYQDASLAQQTALEYAKAQKQLEALYHQWEEQDEQVL
jgi:ATP-binding cassette subfamily F protein 3